MDDLVSVVSSPGGQQYAIFIAPPGSTLDDDGAIGGGVIGLLITLIGAARRAGSGKWRIVVRERSDEGRLGPTLRRSVVSTEAEARVHAEEFARQIEFGEPIRESP